MSEFIEQLLKEVRERLAASRAAVLEYERLQRALAALEGVDRGGAQRPRPRAPDPVSPPVSRRPARRRASSRAANRERLLALVGDRPGVTRAELQNLAGLSAATVSQNLRRMVGRGELSEQALPGGQTGYAVASGEPAAKGVSHQDHDEAADLPAAKDATAGAT
jgi:hypothetical protein